MKARSDTCPARLNDQPQPYKEASLLSSWKLCLFPSPNWWLHIFHPSIDQIGPIHLAVQKSHNLTGWRGSLSNYLKTASKHISLMLVEPAPPHYHLWGISFYGVLPSKHTKTFQEKSCCLTSGNSYYWTLHLNTMEEILVLQYRQSVGNSSRKQPHDEKQAWCRIMLCK